MTDTGRAHHRSLRERGREELLDLLLVNRLATGRDRTRGLAAGVQRVLALVVLRLVRGGQDTRADVRPRAVVERLLLTPEDVRVGVLVEMCRELDSEVSCSELSIMGRVTHEIVGEGRDLLEPADHDVVDALVLALLEESVVDLTCNGCQTSLML